MRKYLAALPLAFLLSPALSQQLPAGNAFVGRYGSSLPTFSNGQIGPLSVDANGRLILAPSSFPSVQPISAASLPLPAGAATAANQGTANTALASIDTKIPLPASGRMPVDGSGVTQPISAQTLPLPNGAATAAGQATASTALALIDGKTPALVNGRQPVDGSGVIQPIAIDQATQGTSNGVSVRNRTLWFAPTLMTASVTANGTTFSAERDQGATAPSAYSFYRILLTCDQAGTLRILGKTAPGSGTIAVAAQISNAANTPVTLSVPALFRVLQAQFVNGATAGTNCTLVDGLTAN